MYSRAPWGSREAFGFTHCDWQCRWGAAKEYGTHVFEGIREDSGNHTVQCHIASRDVVVEVGAGVGSR